MTLSVEASLQVPVMKPQLPTADELVPYLRRIDDARYYSNHGPLLRELEERFAELFKVTPTQLGVVANGTVALSAALVAIGARPGLKCLLPSWTFVGSAAAVWAANLRPHFVDVDPETWMPDPHAIERRQDLDEVGAIMVVSPFGSPVDTQAWEAVERATGIPVIIDGAAAFDTVARIPASKPGRAPVMISLHATKAFGVGEGGLVLSTDSDIAQRINQICNFGVYGSPEGQILGYNGKLSEYHAAVGLAMLDGWEARRLQLADLTSRYARRLRPMAGVSLSPGYDRGWVSSYCNVIVDGDVAILSAELSRRGVETRFWWQRGVHVQSAYRHWTRDRLPVTQALAPHVIGLPFYQDLSDAAFEHVLQALEASLPAARAAERTAS